MKEYVVVFKKEITREQATPILTEKKVEFRKGMDSSRGKIYFYSTGPKFIVKLNPSDVDTFVSDMTKLPEIHEVYEVDWSIQKD